MLRTEANGSSAPTGPDRSTTFRQNSWFSPAKIALTDSSQNTL